MDRLVGVTEARQGFKDLIEEVGDRNVVVLRNNKAVAVMVQPEKLEHLYDRIEELEDQVAMLRYRYAPEDTVSHEIVEKESETSVGVG